MALTRARRHLIIVGSMSNLKRDDCWSVVLDACATSPSACVINATQFLRQQSLSMK